MRRPGRKLPPSKIPPEAACPKPWELLDALQDRVHVESGRLLGTKRIAFTARTVSRGTKREPGR